MSTDLAFWTDLADGAIMFPLGASVPLVLLIARQHRAAIAWTGAIGCVWLVMLVLKLSGYIISATYPNSAFSTFHLLTPSGHVASAALIYGGLVGLLLPRPGTLLKRSVLAAVLTAIVIGETRLLLGVHSLSEVLVGAAVGIAGVAGLAAAAGNAVHRRARLPVLAATVLTIVTFHGDHTTWEETIIVTAFQIIQVWNAIS